MTSPAPADRLAGLPKLGVGLSFQGTLRQFVLESLDTYDFLEIIPDIFWVDQGRGTPGRYRESADAAPFLAQVAAAKPIIAHSVGLSIGSGDPFDREHVAQIASWQERYGFPWHSDHLSFNRLEHASGHFMDTGVTLPVPFDDEVLDLLCERVNEVQAQVPVPFLLENNVYYFEIPEQDMSEAEFLNRLAARTGCGLLLDLHNIYTNSRNLGFDPWSMLDGLDLTRVVEIHLGGGMEVDGVWLDAHSGPCPEEVWAMLEEILPRAPNLSGVVFEMFGNYFPKLGLEPMLGELRRARKMLERRAA